MFQPSIPHYRVELLNALGKAFNGSFEIFSFAPNTRSGLQDGSGGLDVILRTSRTFRFGPVRFVPRALVEVLRRRCPRILVLSWNARQIELLPVLLVAHIRGIPVILWGHGLGLSRSRFALALRQRQARLASAVVTYGDKGREDVLRLWPLANVVPVNNTTGRPAPSESDILLKPSFKVGYVGRIYREKCLSRLIKAIAILRHQGLDLSVTIVGDGPERASIQDLARELSVSDRIEWIGPTTDWVHLRELIQAMDLVVFPEIGGLGVVDAMAAGRASVVFDSEVINPPESSFVVQGVTGFRYSAPTADSLAAEIGRAYSTPGLLRDVSAGCVRFYASKLTLQGAVASFAQAISLARSTVYPPEGLAD